MPVPELMTWIPAQRRWTRMYRGRRYYVSVRQLNCPETKDGSIQAANEWWRNKQADIDLAARSMPRTPSPAEDVVAALHGDGTSLDWHEQLAAMMRQLADGITKAGFAVVLPPKPVDAAMQAEAAELARRSALKDLLGKLIDGEPLPENIAKRLTPARVHQLESAVKGFRGESAASPERTVKAQAEAWLQKQQAMVAVNGMTPARFANVRICISYFIAFLGETADVGIIDAERLDGFHNYLLSKIAERQQDRKAGWSAAYAREVFATNRRWIRWLWERGAIEPPKNLNSRGFKFGSAAKRITTWTPEEVRRVIDEAPGKLKLALMLMTNCGMTQQDVSDLRDDEVDWREGRIIRKRSKTGDRESVPIVNYKLWPATFALLKEHRSRQEIVLLTESGLPHTRQGMKDGKYTCTDIFADTFYRLRKRIGFTKQMKQLRKTSASLLETHEVYGRFSTLFLGHAPRLMKDRHYVNPPQDLFDTAVLWLGAQYGLM